MSYKRKIGNIKYVIPFINQTVGAIFELFLVGLIFSFFNKDKFKKSSSIRICLAVAATILSIRFFVYMAGNPLSKRHFYSFTFIAIIFAVPGLVHLSEIIADTLTKNLKTPFNFGTVKSLTICLFIAICLFKAFTPSKPKIWISKLANTIKDQKTTSKKVIIHNGIDSRVAFLSDSLNIPFTVLENGTLHYRLFFRHKGKLYNEVHCCQKSDLIKSIKESLDKDSGPFSLFIVIKEEVILHQRDLLGPDSAEIIDYFQNSKSENLSLIKVIDPLKNSHSKTESSKDRLNECKPSKIP